MEIGEPGAAVMACGSWASEHYNHTESKIFFNIWANDDTLEKIPRHIASLGVHRQIFLSLAEILNPT